MSDFPSNPKNDESDLKIHLGVLRAIDLAHRDGLISCNMRYEILQNLFPATDDRATNITDFRDCHSSPNPESVSDSTMKNDHVAAKLKRQRVNSRQVMEVFEVTN